MDKILSTNTELAQSLVRHYLAKNDTTRLQKIGLKSILLNNLEFAQKLLQENLESEGGNDQRLDLLVDIIADATAIPTIPAIPVTSDSKLQKVIQGLEKIIKTKPEFQLVYQHRYDTVQTNVKLLSFKKYNDPVIDLDLERHQFSDIPSNIKRIYKDYYGQLEITERGRTYFRPFYICDQDKQNDNEYVIGFLSGFCHNKWISISLDKDGNLLKGTC